MHFRKRKTKSHRVGSKQKSFRVLRFCPGMDSVSCTDVGQRRGRTTGCFGRSHRSHRCPCVQPGGAPQPRPRLGRRPTAFGDGGRGRWLSQHCTPRAASCHHTSLQVLRTSLWVSSLAWGAPSLARFVPPASRLLCYRLCVSQPAPAPTAAPGTGGAAQTQHPRCQTPLDQRHRRPQAARFHQCWDPTAFDSAALSRPSLSRPITGYTTCSHSQLHL